RFVGRSLMQWMHHDDQNLMRREINDIIQGTRARAKFEWRVVISGRSDVHLETVVSNELDNPVLNGLVLNSRDITERKQLEDELTYQAYHDALTGLPNRASFLSSLVSSMGQVREGNALALMFLDLDYFKLMNDTLGHEAGDDLLVKVGNRLSDSLRPGDTLGRLAGDEFTVLLLGLRDRDEGIRVGQRILKRLQEPMEVAGEFRQISTSIGLAFTESSQAAPEDLLRRADSAMYVAKRNGRDRIEAFEPWMEAELVASDLDRRDQSASTDDHEERISPVASRFAH
ncbi:MAG: sensor domain-containing diguanylate cyclase, partial [Thermomicrobiaceae bacterium]